VGEEVPHETAEYLMRVLMLNYEFPPLGGGAGSATYFMSQELARLGCEVVVLTSSSHDDQPAVEHCNGVEVHRVPSFRRSAHHAGLLGAATYLLHARRRLDQLLREREFDLAHFYFALPTGLLAGYWRARTGLPYIVSLRGSDVPNYDRSPVLRIFHKLLHPVSRRILTEAKAVIANSAALRDLALRTFPDVEIDVITNGVCARSFHPSEERRPNDVVRVISVARLIKRKGLEDALNALAAMKARNVELHLVGLGPQMQKIERLAEQLGIADRVVFRGHLRGEELARAYRESDVFLLPSLSESFSMALLEGMASGLPVVATRIGGIPELVEDGVNGLLVPAHAPDRLADALDTLSASPELRARFGRNNRRKIETRYGWSTIARLYIDQFYTEQAEVVFV
jgi:glycogen(starch) synthase